jgi:hypothetical protein
VVVQSWIGEGKRGRESGLAVDGLSWLWESSLVGSVFVVELISIARDHRRVQSRECRECDERTDCELTSAVQFDSPLLSRLPSPSFHYRLIFM